MFAFIYLPESNLFNFKDVLDFILVSKRLNFFRNVRCLDLIINTSIPSQLLNSSNHILTKFTDTSLTPEIQLYCKCLCFLLMRAHDTNLAWITTFFQLPPIRDTYQRQYNYKFEPSFFHLLFGASHLFDANTELTALLMHTYATVLTTNQSENVLRTITPPVVDYLFDQMHKSEPCVPTQAHDRLETLFSDKKLVVCRCLPVLVNALHMSMPDKRQVELSCVLEKCLVAMEEKNLRGQIKLELVRAHLRMLEECGDKAALKIVLASQRFFRCLVERCREQVVLAEPGSKDEATHEFLMLSLQLIKSLLDGSDAVKVS